MIHDEEPGNEAPGNYVAFYTQLLSLSLYPGVIFQAYLCCKARTMEIQTLQKLNLIHSILNVVMIWVLVVLGATVYNSLSLFAASPNLTFLNGCIVILVYIYLAYWLLQACCFITIGLGWAYTECRACCHRRNNSS